MFKIRSVTLEGFKSFASSPPVPESISLPGKGEATNCLRFEENATILIGPNGAGKSVVTSFFRMLNFMTTNALRTYIGRSGGASSILHYGAKRTPVMRGVLTFDETDNLEQIQYSFALAGAARDAMVFSAEGLAFRNRVRNVTSQWELGAGHSESLLFQEADLGEETRRVVFDILSRCRAYQFHDTSDGARVRLGGYIGDNRFLMGDGGNLAAYLHAMRGNPDKKPYYDRIVATIQLAFPQFHDFDLEPTEHNGKTILLNWRVRDHPEYLLGPHQFSDGTLRFIALTTLLLQPPESLPSLIVLDEPELGLHPEAIALLAQLIVGLPANAQVLVATQSPQFVDHFDLSQIHPIELHEGRSVILNLDPDAYREWLEEYSTGELWQKNIVPGGPTNG